MRNRLNNDVLARLIEAIEDEIERIDTDRALTGYRPNPRRDRVREALHNASMALARLGEVLNGRNPAVSHR